MIDVVLCFEATDVEVRLPAVPRVGERILRDAGTPHNEYVVSAVQWYWDLTEPGSEHTIYVFVDEVDR